MSEPKIRLAQVTALETRLDTIYTQANSAYGAANTASSTGGGGYDQANNAYTQANAAYGAANTRLSASGGTLSGDLIVTGNLTVSGNSTTLNTEVLTVEDADVVLLSNVASTPALNAGIIVNRGTSTNTFLRWNEVTDRWGWSDDGTTFYNLDTSLSAYSQANAAYGAANNRVLKAGDTMTGQLNISSGGLLVTGNVGIGTNSPAYKLDVNGTFNTSGELITQGNDARISIYRSGGINYFDWSSGQSLYFSTQTSSGGAGRSTKFVIDANGNVGIGTTNPTARLNVYGAGTANDPCLALDVTSSSTFVHAQESFAPNLTTNQTVLHVIGREGSTKNSGYIGYTYSGTPGSDSNRLTFGHWAADHLMTLTGAGNVGIGTTNPAVKLHVEGSLRLSATGYLGFGGGTNYIEGDNTNNIIKFGTNNVDRARFTSDGHFRPAADNTYNLGATDFRWANIYTADLNLSNRDSQNDVDGTWGEWTIQEGENDLYLINRRNGKKFKFMLKEVE